MMPKMHFQLLLAALLFSVPNLWAGGSVIGNGAGLAENNFQYSFQLLPKVIENFLGSLSNDTAALTPSERTLLLQIKEMALANSKKSDRLVFVSEALNPVFFDTGVTEKNRIAKTELKAGVPIYINVDLLYSVEGQVVLDLPQMLSLLIHELGHQTGLENHTQLDILGSKLRAFASEMWQSVTLPLTKDKGGPIVVQTLNQTIPFMASSVYVQWQGRSKILSEKFNSDFRCLGENEKFAGIQVYNGHFDFSQAVNSSASLSVSNSTSAYSSAKEGAVNESLNSRALFFAAWADLFCFDESHNSIRVQKISFSYVIDGDLNFIFKGFHLLE